MHEVEVVVATAAAIAAVHVQPISSIINMIVVQIAVIEAAVVTERWGGVKGEGSIALKF